MIPAVASAAVLWGLAALHVRGDSIGGQPTTADGECAYDAASGLCVPAGLQAAEAAAVTITGMLQQCMMSMPMTPKGGCAPGAPAFCVGHEFEDEPGMMFCVTEGFAGASFVEFEAVEDAYMNCIGLELSAACRPAVMAWYETLGCSSCAAVEFAVRTCMMRTTAAECGADTADTRVVSILGPGPALASAEGPTADPDAALDTAPPLRQEPFTGSPADAAYGGVDYYADGSAGGPAAAYLDYDYYFSFMRDGADAPAPGDAYGPDAYAYDASRPGAYESDPYAPGAYMPYVYEYGSDAYGPGPVEAYDPYDLGYGYGFPPADAYSLPPVSTGDAYGPEDYTGFGYTGYDAAAYGPDSAVDGLDGYGYFGGFGYDYGGSAVPRADGPGSMAVFGRPFFSAQPPVAGGGAGAMPPAARLRMRRARRMRPADPPRMRRMRMMRMRRMRRAHMG